MALTLAIDLGTTNLKVGLVNEQGEILLVRSSRLQTHSREAGAAEHDPEELKRLLFDMFREVLTDDYKDQVEYIVSSTYQFGLMMLDAERKPITAITLLTDIRSQQTFSDFLGAFADEDVYQKTGCPLISQYVLPRLFYFSKEQPLLFKKTKYFTDSKSFLFEWLTGEWVTDISIAAATQFYNAHHFQWDEDLLSRLNLSPDQFPPAEDGTKFIAPLKKELCTTLGLKKNVQVILGVYDGAALAVALSGLAPNVGIINIGTTAMLRVPGDQPALDKHENKRIQAYALQKGNFLNGGALNNAALPLDWMRNNLFDVDLQDEVLLQITNEPPLISLPYLTGERDSKTGPYASGVFFGIRRSHSRTDFARSVLEGVAYSMRYLYDALQENNLHVKEVRMGGGGVNIKVWPQIFADVLGVPVTISAVNEMALIGSSMLALTAGGVFKDLNEASEKMLKESKRIEPNTKSVTIHDERYQFFKKLRETLGPLYKEHAELRS
ncbi:MAG: gluconokinase [Flavisolibacter sp.]|nr:gluconokinase [Flavisolibacter sp.]